MVLAGIEIEKAVRSVYDHQSCLHSCVCTTGRAFRLLAVSWSAPGPMLSRVDLVEPLHFLERELGGRQHVAFECVEPLPALVGLSQHSPDYLLPTISCHPLFPASCCAGGHSKKDCRAGATFHRPVTCQQHAASSCHCTTHLDRRNLAPTTRPGDKFSGTSTAPHRVCVPAI